jgi:hypothetical protein
MKLVLNVVCMVLVVFGSPDFFKIRESVT